MAMTSCKTPFSDSFGTDGLGSPLCSQGTVSSSHCISFAVSSCFSTSVAVLDIDKQEYSLSFSSSESKLEKTDIPGFFNATSAFSFIDFQMVFLFF
ncbi:hypothetical protein XENTR_v10002705 [Xenopus tropicalis]|nr:hypothetical protein XENTR_v10002705 [Xenopus tropicalis]